MSWGAEATAPMSDASYRGSLAQNADSDSVVLGVQPPLAASGSVVIQFTVTAVYSIDPSVPGG